MLLISLGLGPEVPSATGPVDALVVPGCPTEADGSLSFCLVRRILWAHHLYEEGVAEHLIVSGGAVANPYVEAEALREGLVALGVPTEAIVVEPRALHTDENLGYSAAIAEAEGWTWAVASDARQCKTVCHLMRKWDRDCAVLPADYDLVHARRIAMPVPEIELEPVEGWVPRRKQEDRAPSWFVYSTAGLREMPQPEAEAR